MKETIRLIAATLLVGGMAMTGTAWAGSPEQAAPLPTSLHLQQVEILDQVAALAAKPAPIGPAAGQLQTMLMAHIAYLDGVILPPLTLLPTIAATDVGPEMKWALPLIERAKAEQQQRVQLDEQLTERLVVLFQAAQEANDAQAVRLAQDIAAWLEGVAEVTEPATQLVGKYLRVRFASGS